MSANEYDEKKNIIEMQATVSRREMRGMLWRVLGLKKKIIVTTRSEFRLILNSTLN